MDMESLIITRKLKNVTLMNKNETQPLDYIVVLRSRGIFAVTEAEFNQNNIRILH